MPQNRRHRVPGSNEVAAEERRAEAVRREPVIRVLAAQGTITHAEQLTASEHLGLSRAHLLRLVKRYREQSTTQSLAARSRGPRPGQRRLSEPVEAIITQGLKRDYLKRERPSVSTVTRSIAHDCRAAGYPVPSRKAIQTRISSHSAMDLAKAREGSNAARSRLGVVRRAPAPASALELVQIDHTKIDVHVVDDVSRAPIGRPWLTVVFDVASRVVLGFHISLDSPSSNTVAQAISQAVLPKDAWLLDHNISLLWPAYGLPQVLHVDNASEFHAAALRYGCHEHGIDLRFRPPGRPHYGGHIERLMGTLMLRLHSLPGTTFSNVGERGDYPSEKKAILSLRELERLVALEILGTYHNEVHATLKQPPISVWCNRAGAFSPRLPADPDAFVRDFLPSVERVVRRDGIHLFNLTYFDGALGLLLDGQGQRRTVRYDPNDLSAVFLQMSDGGHLRVPYASLERPAATLWEHRLAMRALLQDGRRAVDEDAIFEAIKQQREVLATAAATSKAARRASTRSREARRTYRDHRPDDDARGDEELESSPPLDPAGHWRTESWS